MKTPITDKLYWELQGRYGTGTFEDVLPLACRLEQDRAALMEALESTQKAVSIRAKTSFLFRGVEKQINSALSAARANFPDED